MFKHLTDYELAHLGYKIRGAALRANLAANSCDAYDMAAEFSELSTELFDAYNLREFIAQTNVYLGASHV